MERKTVKPGKQKEQIRSKPRKGPASAYGKESEEVEAQEKRKLAELKWAKSFG
jgi:hypothetical protein